MSANHHTSISRPSTMQDYKVTRGHWPSSRITILLFIVAFEIACYYMLAPLIELIKAN